MNKNLSDWAHIAEIISGLAVVVTLVILILQIRENSDIARASLYEASVAQMNNLAIALIADPELTKLAVAFNNSKYDDLDPADQRRLGRIVTTRFRNYDVAYLMWTSGIFGENEWGRYEAAVCQNYYLISRTPMKDGVLSRVSPEFRSFLAKNCSN